MDTERRVTLAGGNSALSAPRLPEAAAQEIAPKPANPLQDLIKVVAAATDHSPPWLVQSIFGKVSSWLPPYRRHSEVSALSYWDPLGTLSYLIAITVPSFSREAPRVVRKLLPPFARRLFWRPSFYYREPDSSLTSFMDEQWFFINGMATDPKLARMNANLLSELFGRPITGIYNATNSLFLDLIQCAVGKSYKIAPNLDDERTLTRPAYMSARAILNAVKDPSLKRVVVIAHSQGTIIAANVLRAVSTALEVADALRDHQPVREDLDAVEQEACNCLLPEQPERLTEQEIHDHFAYLVGKMEFYLFSNCADRFNYVLTTKNEDGETTGLPHLENFANEYDVIAHLGVLSPLRVTQPEIISIDGFLYHQTGDEAWGHFLNAHYLEGIERHLLAPERISNPYPAAAPQQPKVPRLYRYYGGQRPRAYISTGFGSPKQLKRSPIAG